jgi:hypothetical protein
MSDAPSTRSVADGKPVVLMISTGGGVSEAILDCLAAYRDRLTIVGTTTDPTAIGASDCDVCVPVAPVTVEDEFIRDIGEVLQVFRPQIAFPCRDADLVGLARLKTSRSEGAEALLVGSMALATAMNDKLPMVAFARRCGLPFASTAHTEVEALDLVRRHGFPLIAKPRQGSGSKGVYVLLSDSHLESCLNRGGFVFQPYIDPPADLIERLPDTRLGLPFEQSGGLDRFVAIRGLSGRSGELVNAIKVDVVNQFGRPFRLTRRPLDAVDSQIAEAVAGTLFEEDYVGAFALQGRVDRTGTLTYFEMLTRIGGGTAGFVPLGCNQPRLLVEMFAGIELPETTAQASVVEWRSVPRPRAERSTT